MGGLACHSYASNALLTIVAEIRSFDGERKWSSRRRFCMVIEALPEATKMAKKTRTRIQRDNTMPFIILQKALSFNMRLEDVVFKDFSFMIRSSVHVPESILRHGLPVNLPVLFEGRWVIPLFSCFFVLIIIRRCP